MRKALNFSPDWHPPLSYLAAGKAEILLLWFKFHTIQHCKKRHAQLKKNGVQEIS